MYHAQAMPHRAEHDVIVSVRFSGDSDVYIRQFSLHKKRVPWE
jgi:hypothetical protein